MHPPDQRGMVTLGAQMVGKGWHRGGKIVAVIVAADL